jgi:hypothetical protein
MNIKYLASDFTPAPEFQTQVDKSSGYAKVYVDNENNNLWFVKPAHFISSALSQLIGSKIYKNFLGEYSSTDILVKDKDKILIASKEVKDFKTLNFVGDLCDNKQISGIAKLHAIRLLLDDGNNEPNNLGWIVKDHTCIATKVDPDESLQIASYRSKNKFSNYQINFDWSYRTLEQYHASFRYKVALDKEKSNISMGEFWNHEKLEEVKLDKNYNLNDLEPTLKEKILAQINEYKDYIILNIVDMKKLDSDVYSYPFYTKEEFKEINTQELITTMKDIINMDLNTIISIVHSVVEEVQQYFNEQDLASEDVNSFAQLEERYINYLVKNQQIVKSLYNTILKQQTIEACYVIGHQQDITEFDSFIGLKILHDEAAKLYPHLSEVKETNFSQEQKDICTNAFFNWEKDSPVLEWMDQASVIEAMKNIVTHQSQQFRTALQFTNDKQVRILEKLINTNKNNIETSIKTALQFDANGKYNGNDDYAKAFFVSCNPFDYSTQNCINSFDTTKVSGEDNEYIIFPS